MQSKLSSFIEANMNTFAGTLLAWLVMHYIIRPVWNLPISEGDSFAITMIFTVVSVGRNYAIRRWVNFMEHHPRGKERVAQIKYWFYERFL